MNVKHIKYVKYALYVIILTGILIWRFNKTTPEKNTTLSTNTQNIEELPDNSCDSTKVKGFKNNLTKLPNSLSQKNVEIIDKAVKEFMDQYCKMEPLVCKPFLNRYHELYNTDHSDIQLGLSAYILENANIEDDKGGNIKVISLFEKGNMVQYFILDDLMGEILVELSGFEGNLANFTIWGSAFPYFVQQYGKFKLVNKQGVFSMTYECLIK